MIYNQQTHSKSFKTMMRKKISTRGKKVNMSWAESVIPEETRMSIPAHPKLQTMRQDNHSQENETYNRNDCFLFNIYSFKSMWKPLLIAANFLKTSRWLLNILFNNMIISLFKLFCLLSPPNSLLSHLFPIRPFSTPIP